MPHSNQQPEHAHSSHDASTPSGSRVKDPVCGMMVDPAKAKGTHDYQGTTYSFCSTGCAAKFQANPEKYVGQPATTKAIDPVCGMSVDPASAKATHDHDGTTYYFCCSSCANKFKADPKKYLSAEHRPSHAHMQSGSPNLIQIGGLAAPPPRPPAASDDVMYTCPMHPEIQQKGPGSCPLCGMALEPMEISAEEEANPELEDMSRRFWISLVLSAPVLILAMSDMIPGQPIQNLLTMKAINWIQFALATPVVLWGGYPFFERGLQSVLTRNLNMFTLIAIGTGIAYIYSVVATLFPHLFPANLMHHGTIAVYFESAAVIIVLVLLGQVLELKARGQTNRALRELLQLAPKHARVITASGEEIDLPIEEVNVGTRLRVRPGERVPVDGEILEGSATIDESMVTGEPIPNEKGPHDKVTAGTVNNAGTFIMEAKRVGRDTLLAQIVRMVSDAQRSRAPIQGIADKVASYFVPAVVLTSIITFIVWFFWGPEPQLAHAMINAVAVLIIACPCALGLATPMSIMVGTGRGAREGVLIRNAEALERLEKIDTIVVDKTGTLTEGRPSVSTVLGSGDHGEDEILRLAASLEQGSEHPLAAAVVRLAKEKQIPLEAPKNFTSKTGIGVSGEVDGKKVAIGTLKLFAGQSTLNPTLQQMADELRRKGATVIFVFIEEQPAGLIGIADAIKESTPHALQSLRKEGLHVVMLTGDNRVTAQAVAKDLGIDAVEAEVLPEQKSNVVAKFQSENKVVAMAGDGINDAPALAKADVGIAMGTGTDIAMESAGVTLVKGDLRGIVRARRLSRATMKNIRQNLFFAFIYNTVGVPVAAGVLYPFFGILLSPMIASAAMSLSSVSVITNALRLRGVKL